LPKRPSRDVTRRIQPCGLSPPAKTRIPPTRFTNAPLGLHELEVEEL